VADDAHLLDVASAVAEGSDVDWEIAEGHASDDRQRSIVRELRVLATMASVVRTPHATLTVATPPLDTGIGVGSMWGHLRICEEIGEGSFGKVYRAWDTRLECEVALKLVKSSGVSPAWDLSRSITEARRLARVRHKNVVRVLGADSHDDRFGLWMELVAGRSLQQVLTMQGPMSPSEATPVGIDLCHALAAVHGAGLLHRDIKAHNVLRESGGRIVLMDFGTGRDIAGPKGLTDSLAGTPLYLAPELFLEHEPSVASDVYSLGVLLYHLVTGEYPVQGTRRRDVELAHQQAQRKLLRDVRPDLPSAFVDVVERALAPNPQNRYASAGEFGDALAGVAGFTYTRDSLPIPMRWRWKWPVAMAAGVALAIIGITRFDDLVSRRAGSGQPPATMSSGSTLEVKTGTAAVLPADTSYKIGASFYAVRNGQNVRLTQGSRVAPGDKLFATIEASEPVYVYVINRDEAGQSFLLFPLPGYLPENPIPLSQVNHLPGSRNGERYYWEVSTPGVREHFFVYVTPRRLVEFEQLLAALPRAELGRTVRNMPLSASAIGVLRGVGGLSPAEKTSPSASDVDLTELAPLPDANETASGVWARKVVFENPMP
jgi:hypothetical protein